MKFESRIFLFAAVFLSVVAAIITRAGNEVLPGDVW